MYNLLRKQIILLIIALTTLNAVAQKEQWRSGHDELQYYFGATLGYNVGYLSAAKSDKFLMDDSILVAEPASTGGISLGFHATAKLSKHWQARFNPQIILGGARYFSYTLNKKYFPNEEDEMVSLLVYIGNLYRDFGQYEKAKQMLEAFKYQII